MNSDFAGAAQRLADVLMLENEALKRMDFPAATALVPAKEAALGELMRHSGATAIPPALAVLGQRIGRLADENRSLLECAIAVQTRVVRIVARACAPPPATKHYGGPPPRAPSNRAAALALSTRA